MAKDKINDTTFSIILQIHKNFNWNDVIVFINKL